MTAPLYRAEVELGLELDAVVEIVEADPQPAPASGSEWAAEIDWPRVRLTITLPSPGDKLPGALVSDLVLLGRSLDPPYTDFEHLGYRWGALVRAGTPDATQVRGVDERAEYLADAVAKARDLADQQLAPLIAHVRRRAERLAQREATLARGRAGRQHAETTTDRPIEIDSAPRAIAPDADPAIDDSSARFALLELDADTAPAKARNRRRKVA